MAAPPPTQPPLPTLNLSEAIAVMDDEKNDLDKVIETLLKPENIAHLTELNQNQVLAFTTMATIVESYPKLTVLKTFVARNLAYRVSKGRKGRGEFVKVLSRPGYGAPDDLQGQPRTGVSRWFRRRP